jgi:hypothetical protein
MMNADGADLMENGRRMANGEASKESLRNLAKAFVWLWRCGVYIAGW